MKSPEFIEPEFDVHMSHLDQGNLVPATCKWACQSMGYPLAAFEAGTACLCKNSTEVFYELGFIDDCRLIPCSKFLLIIKFISNLGSRVGLTYCRRDFIDHGVCLNT